MLCKIAQVSPSGYYQWFAHANDLPKDYYDYLLIKEVFEKHKRRIGWRQVRMKLERKNIVVNHKKIKRIMRKYDLRCKVRRKNPYKAIMKKTAEHRTFENALNRNFFQIIPYRVFGTDITYISFNHRFAYLAIVKDLASGEIVAWHVSQHITMELVMTTMEQMKHFPNVMIHSDQGFHFTNPIYIQKVNMLQMLQSMSRKANCIDNAPVESFFGHFKDEVDYESCRTFEELYELIKNSIQYYNYERAQWGKNKMTPVEYRDHLLAQSAS